MQVRVFGDALEVRQARVLRRVRPDEVGLHLSGRAVREEEACGGKSHDDGIIIFLVKGMKNTTKILLFSLGAIVVIPILVTFLFWWSLRLGCWFGIYTFMC